MRILNHLILQLHFPSSKGSLLLIAVVIMTGCVADKKPDTILTEQEMVRTLTEIYMSEEKIARLNLRRDSAEKIFELAKPIVFKKMGVSDSVFQKSFNYYVDRPQQLELIYTAVVDSLNLWEQKIGVKSEAQK